MVFKAGYAHTFLGLDILLLILLLDLRLLLMILGCMAREGPEVGYSSPFC